MLDDFTQDLARLPGDGLARLALALRTPGTYAIALYRLRQELNRSLPRPLVGSANVLLAPVAAALSWSLGIHLAPTARIGPGLYIGHWGGIRVGPTVELGAGCNLSPGVILGSGMVDGLRGEPRLGDRVYVGAGAKIFGPIQVGSGVAVGANAVVCRDVPDGVTVGGVPARTISRNGSAAYLEVGQPHDADRPAVRNQVVGGATERNELVVERTETADHFDPQAS